MERRTIAVRGTVQGVGFRPFVYGLASRLRLGGFVSNVGADVRIEVEGEARLLDEFLSGLAAGPPLARIESLDWEPSAPRGERGFRIEQSVAADGPVAIAPDVATCDACLRELFNPGNRRYRYPFLNCTDCGPRLTIVTGVPYDRQRTTMARFAMCAACRAEYDNPLDRRFHAQPTACPVCGPRLAAAGADGAPLEVPDPLAWVVELLGRGGIAAVKGLGGYHLVCDARSANATRELRRRKQRDDKPFAVMAADLGAARELCEISDAEAALLQSPARPIVLLARRPGGIIAEEVAPKNPTLGIMLPYTPLHHLLLRGMGAPLVMTSGNRSDEPIATSEPEVFERLGAIADGFLTHDRLIHVRCDDSVTRVLGGFEAPVRRSRGFAPRPIRLPLACPAPILAVGGQLKATFALGQQRQATLSHHLGDLDHFQAYVAFERDVALYQRLFAIAPAVIAHDLHPDYASTRYARRRAESEPVRLVAVQHHHAHMASCMAEHGIEHPVIGVCFDGTGYGTDGAVWGGEFLVGDFRSFTRAAHLRYVPMPGGERAIRQPWRMAAAHLADAGTQCPSLRRRIATVEWNTVEQMLRRRFNAPMTSSAGRLFDAVASIAGLRDCVNFEGQAAMELEWLAARGSGDEPYPLDADATDRSNGSETLVLDTRPIIVAVTEDVRRSTPAERIARRFHFTMADLIVRTCRQIRDRTGLDTATLSGGVFMNALLSEIVQKQLLQSGFCPLSHRVVPPNDGGLSLGQLCVAAGQIGDNSCA